MSDVPVASADAGEKQPEANSEWQKISTALGAKLQQDGEKAVLYNISQLQHYVAPLYHIDLHKVNTPLLIYMSGI